MVNCSPLKGFIMFFAAICVISLSGQRASAIVLHTGHDPNLAKWTDRPHTAITGRWGKNGSCIAIAPNYVITTTHQGGSLATIVTIDGVGYSIDKIFNYPLISQPADPNHYKIDLRLVKLNSANLENYAEIYTASDEESVSGYTILTGFGLGRDDNVELSTGGITYGYQWQNQNAKNFNLRYATNEIDDTLVNHKLSEPYIFDVLVAHFGESTDTLYEGSISKFDSGGGWFIKYDGAWKLVALNWGSSFHENPNGPAQSWFRDKTNPNDPAPDTMIGLRLSPHVNWIMNTIENVCDQYPGTDFNGDCIVDTADLAHFAQQWLNTECDETNNFCEHADLFRDGKVDAKDFAKLAQQWLNI